MKIRPGLASSFLLLAALTAGAAGPQLAQAQPAAAEATQPDATLSLEGGTVAAGVGFVWGSGTLDFGGTTHKVKVSGLSILDVGAAKISASGSVYNLKNIADMDGTYTSFAAGATVAGGGGVAYLRNQNGVVIRLDSTTEGLRLNLSASGVTLKVES